MVIHSHTRTLLEAILLQSRDSFLVGGFVRDHLLNRTSSVDIDVAVNGNGFEIARSVCSGLPEIASFAPLDPVNACGRIVLKNKPNAFIDVCALKAPSINEDLRKRDFTINAIAISLSDYLRTGFDKLIDPHGAMKDLEELVIRACSSDSFSDDPLRILRAYRFAGQLGFHVEAATQSLMRISSTAISQVSGERIRDELSLIMAQQSCAKILVEMEQMGLLTDLFPELAPMKGCDQNQYHSMDVWDHSIDCVNQLETTLVELHAIFGPFADKIQDYLDFEPCHHRSRLWLLKLACVFHDAGKPASVFTDDKGVFHFYGHEKKSAEIFTRAVERLKLSNREQNLVSMLISGHMRLSSMTMADPPSKRFLFRLTDRFGLDVIGLSLLFIADLKASCGPLRKNEHIENAVKGVKSLLDYLFSIPAEPLIPFVNGNDLMNFLGIPPGPKLGRIIRILHEKQALGLIKSREESFDVASVMCRESGEKSHRHQQTD